ncbi:hypothetical protein Q3G72_015339 [Acer saccharum]|nr:hypothetical protein Q3G72_015339 [Acer saccharum]
MSDSKIPHYDCSTLLFKVTTTTLTKSQKRWRLAYWTIYSFRAMRSLVHKNKPNHQYSEILQSHPYVALDIEPSSSLHQDKKSVSYSIDPNVDGSKLTDIVKKKDLHSLGCIGGVEGVATALGTNPEDGIDGNDEDVAKRSQLFEHGAEEGWLSTTNVSLPPGFKQHEENGKILKPIRAYLGRITFLSSSGQSMSFSSSSPKRKISSIRSYLRTKFFVGMPLLIQKLMLELIEEEDDYGILLGMAAVEGERLAIKSRGPRSGG